MYSFDIDKNSSIEIKKEKENYKVTFKIKQDKEKVIFSFVLSKDEFGDLTSKFMAAKLS